jgi:hypothetical protein
MNCVDARANCTCSWSLDRHKHTRTCCALIVIQVGICHDDTGAQVAAARSVAAPPSDRNRAAHHFGREPTRFVICPISPPNCDYWTKRVDANGNGHVGSYLERGNVTCDPWRFGELGRVGRPAPTVVRTPFPWLPGDFVAGGGEAQSTHVDAGRHSLHAVADDRCRRDKTRSRTRG